MREVDFETTQSFSQFPSLVLFQTTVTKYYPHLLAPQLLQIKHPS